MLTNKAFYCCLITNKNNIFTIFSHYLVPKKNNNMKCKHLKIRSKKYKKYFYCDILKKEIDISNCSYCKSKDYKAYKPIRKRSSNLVRREKHRYSIIYQDLAKCSVCGSKLGIEKNEIFSGSYRHLSIEYGMVNPLCKKHHELFHKDREFNLRVKVQFEEEFLKEHSLDEFIQLFGKDYKITLKEYLSEKKR